MKLVGVMPVRNEAWCLGLSARVALKWCDTLIVGLHDCTDESETICDRIMVDERPDRIVVVDLPRGTWDEMRHRQILLEMARRERATHIAIIDADEVLTGNLLTVDDPLSNDTPLQRCLPWMPPGSIFQFPGYNLRKGLYLYHSNGVWGNRWFSVAFADDPRLSWSGDKSHSREPLYPEHPRAQLKPYQPVSQGQGGVMHLWGASERRLKAKHALYKLTERLRWPEKSVREIDELYSLAIHGSVGGGNFGTPESWTYSPVPASWWTPYADLMQYLDVYAEPWQEAECVRLVKEHGPRMFQGLDLFGVV